MEFVASLFPWAMAGWLVILMTIVLFRVLTGRIRLRGLLTTDGLGGQDPERVALLVITVGTASYYLLAGLQLDLPTDLSTTALPEVPEEVLFLLGGAQTGYLSGKSFRRFKGS